jgi:hypothetical protein
MGRFRWLAAVPLRPVRFLIGESKPFARSSLKTHVIESFENSNLRRSFENGVGGFGVE